MVKTRNISTDTNGGKSVLWSASKETFSIRAPLYLKWALKDRSNGAIHGWLAVVVIVAQRKLVCVHIHKHTYKQTCTHADTRTHTHTHIERDRTTLARPSHCCHRQKALGSWLSAPVIPVCLCVCLCVCVCVCVYVCVYVCA
jgi:hypothetical protein